MRQCSIELIFIFFRKLTLPHIAQYSLRTLHSAAHSTTKAVEWKNSLTFSHRKYFSYTIALRFLMPLNILLNFFPLLNNAAFVLDFWKKYILLAVCLLLRFQWHVPIAVVVHSLPLLGYGLWWLLPVTAQEAQEATCISLLIFQYICMCILLCLKVFIGFCYFWHFALLLSLFGLMRFWLDQNVPVILSSSFASNFNFILFRQYLHFTLLCK